jgi:2-phospho-L-lactate guanylyltransferase
VTTVAVLPIKRFGVAKQRLGAVPDKLALVSGMVGEVLDALAGASGLAGVVVVTGDPAARDAVAGRTGFEVVDEPSPLGHSAAAEVGIVRARELGATRVLLVPGDCPLLTVSEVDGLLERHPGPGVVVVPDRHGTGTNALLLAPPDAIRPAFGEGSRERHVALAGAAGVPCAVDEVPGLLLDVDTPEDLDLVAGAR